MKLGFNICESTVQRYMPKNGKRNNGQNWKTFLQNHSKEIISIDFLTVPTIHFKLVHILVVIEHYRRKLIYFNVTMNPTAEWSIQQIRNLLFDNETPKYLIRDRDKKYGTLLAELYDWRQKGDYDNIFDYDSESVKPLFDSVLEMINQIDKEIKNAV